MENCIIVLEAKDGKAGYKVAGEKTDLKDLLFSLMKEDRVFASLCAIALLDFCDEEDGSVKNGLDDLIKLAHEQMKK